MEVLTYMERASDQCSSIAVLMMIARNNKDVVENATWTPNLYVCNCNFGPTSGRGILCTTRGKVVIENNRFRNLWGPAMLIEDDCNFWFESGYTKNVIFRNKEKALEVRVEITSFKENATVLCPCPVEAVHINILLFIYLTSF